MKGININCSQEDFVNMILTGKKTIETRSGKSYSRLDKYIGKRVGIIRTGCGQATLEGWVTITGKVIYETEEDFLRDMDKHQVRPDSDYYIGQDGKVGYILSDIQLLPYGMTENVYSRGILTRECFGEIGESLEGCTRRGYQDGWELYMKMVNGKGYWIATKDNYRPFHISYEQALGREPIDCGKTKSIDFLRRELGRLLLSH